MQSVARVRRLLLFHLPLHTASGNLSEAMKNSEAAPVQQGGRVGGVVCACDDSLRSGLAARLCFVRILFVSVVRWLRFRSAALGWCGVRLLQCRWGHCMAPDGTQMAEITIAADGNDTGVVCERVPSVPSSVCVCLLVSVGCGGWLAVPAYKM